MGCPVTDSGIDRNGGLDRNGDLDRNGGAATGRPVYPPAAWVQAQVVMRVADLVLVARGRGTRRWTFPFDLVTVEETVEQVVRRLVRESAGVRADVLDLKSVIERGSVVASDDHGVTLLFETVLPGAVLKRPQKDGLLWVNPAKLAAVHLYPPELRGLCRPGADRWHPLGI